MINYFSQWRPLAKVMALQLDFDLQFNHHAIKRRYIPLHRGTLSDWSWDYLFALLGAYFFGMMIYSICGCWHLLPNIDDFLVAASISLIVLISLLS